METTVLGATGLEVTKLGLGLAALGRPGYINLGHGEDLAGDYGVAAMEARTHAVLDEAWQLGIRYFDAARSYGRAEDFLGTWLASRGLAPDEAIVASKWGYVYAAGWRVAAAAHEVKRHEPEIFARQLEETRERLGPWLDLYQIHSATLESRVLENAAVLEALVRLRESGVRIGLSVSGRSQAEVVRRALAVQVDGIALFDAVQATWNPIEPSVGPALAEARAAGLGVIVKEALANGRLTSRTLDPRVRSRLDREGARLGCPLDALALAFALEQPFASVVLSGAATPAQLRSNCRAVDVVLDDQARASLAELVEPPEAYWAERGRLAWN